MINPFLAGLAQAGVDATQNFASGLAKSQELDRQLKEKKNEYLIKAASHAEQNGDFSRAEALLNGVQGFEDLKPGWGKIAQAHYDQEQAQKQQDRVTEMAKNVQAGLYDPNTGFEMLKAGGYKPQVTPDRTEYDTVNLDPLKSDPKLGLGSGITSLSQLAATQTSNAKPELRNAFNLSDGLTSLTLDPNQLTGTKQVERIIKGGEVNPLVGIKQKVDWSTATPGTTLIGRDVNGNIVQEKKIPYEIKPDAQAKIDLAKQQFEARQKLQELALDLKSRGLELQAQRIQDMLNRKGSDKTKFDISYQTVMENGKPIRYMIATDPSTLRQTKLRIGEAYQKDDGLGGDIPDSPTPTNPPPTPAPVITPPPTKQKPKPGKGGKPGLVIPK